MSEKPPQTSCLRDIAPGIWALGFVSLLMDISPEMIHALLSVYSEHSRAELLGEAASDMKPHIVGLIEIEMHDQTRIPRFP